MLACVLAAALPARAEDRPLRLAVTDFLVQGAAQAELGRALGDVAAAEAASVGGYSVVSQGDIAAQLGLEARKQLLGCAGDESCMVEVAGSLDVDRLLAGVVTAVEGTCFLSVRLLDVRRLRTLARIGDTLPAASQPEVVDSVRRLAHEALTGRKLDTTGVVRVEVTEADARVALDGADLGRSPLAGGRRVHEGAHRIVVQKEGFIPWEGTVSVSAGATVPVSVSLVKVESIEKARTVYAELFGGVTLPPAMGVLGVDDCSGGCVANGGGIRGGYLLTPRLGVELFLVPYLDNLRASEHPLQTTLGGLPARTDRYRQEASMAGTFGGLSLVYRFFDTWPLMLRMWTGAGRAGVYATGSGLFFDAPGQFEPYQETYWQSASFWTPFVGPELRFGVRLSKGLQMDVGAAAIVTVLPSMTQAPGRSARDPDVVLPKGPGFRGGAAWIFPATVSLRMDFGS